MIFQPAFMGAVPKHALLQTWEHLLAEPEILSAICLPDLHQFRGGHEIWLHGGVAFTAIAILFAREGESLFPVPPNLGSLHHESQGSWYLPGSKFGNATKDSAVTNLDAEKHVTNVKANAKFQETLCGWSDAGKARALINCHLNSVHWLSGNRVT